MKYVIDSLEDKSKNVIYYIEAGDAMTAMIFNPDVSVLMNHMDKRYNVIKCIWGGEGGDANMEEAKHHTKAIAVQVVR